VAAALDVSERTVFRTNRRYVEGGLELYTPNFITRLPKFRREQW
jgi:hypothetical protein